MSTASDGEEPHGAKRFQEHGRSASMSSSTSSSSVGEERKGYGKERRNGGLSMSTISSVDDEAETVVDGPLDCFDRQRAKRKGRVWPFLAKMITFWIPNIILRWVGFKTDSQCQAWREKVLLFSIVLVASGAFVAVVEIAGGFLSPPRTNFSIPDLADTDFVAVNGRVAEFSTSQDPMGKTIYEQVSPYAGQDVSTMFPTFTLLSRPLNSSGLVDPDLNAVMTSMGAVDNWLNTRLTQEPGYIVNASHQMLQQCPTPDRENGNDALCFTSSTERVISENVVGYVLHNAEIINLQNNNLDTSAALVIIDSLVYDVTWYLRIATRYPDNRQQINPSTAFLSEPVTRTLMNHLGGDASAAFKSIPNRIQNINAMNKLFFAGVLDDAMPPDTFKFNPVLLGVGALVYLVFVIKIFMTLSTGSAPRLTTAPYTIFFVPVYNEEAVTIQRSIESIVNSNYDAMKRLLFVVVDGVAVRPGSYRDCGSTVTGILGCSGLPASTLSYVSIGQGVRKVNAARVYSGVFTASKGSQIPYIVVVKSGSDHETTLPGTRGKRDSMLIVLTYLMNLTQPSQALLTPLEHEIHRQITRKLKMDPTLFKYFAVIDGDSYVETNAVKRLVGRLERNDTIMAIHGKLQPVSKTTTFATILQAYPWFHLHHLAPCLDSVLGSVGRSWGGGFAVYRLVFEDGTPCLVSERVLREFARTACDMSTQNALHLGEDKFLPPLLLQAHARPNHLEYNSSAIAYSDMPTRFRTLMAQQRRSFNARYNILVSIPFCIRRPMVPFMAYVEVIAMTLSPVATAYLYYIVTRIIMLVIIKHCPAISLTNTDILVSIAIGTLFILQALLFLATLNIKSMFPLFAYMVFGIPLYQIVIPLWGFWSMDRAVWSDTVVVERAGWVRVHGADGTCGGEVSVRNKRKLSTGPIMMPFETYQEPTTEIGINMVQDHGLTDTDLDTPIATYVRNRISPYHIKTSLERTPTINSAATTLPATPASTTSFLSPADATYYPLSTPISTPPIKSFLRPVMTPALAAMLDNDPRTSSRPPSDVISPYHLNRKSTSSRSFRVVSGVTSHYPSFATVGSAETAMTLRSSFASSSGMVPPEFKLAVRDQVYNFLGNRDLNSVTARGVLEFLGGVFGEGALKGLERFVRDVVEEYTLEALALM
ncbi:chitin synthase [Spizellomyces sp. 'palustris']|nr:chitin synthase [Spizellomyces sp. 'palustris']